LGKIVFPILAENPLQGFAMTTKDQNPGDIPFRTWMCQICGFIYDEAAGLPEEGIAPGTRWEDIPMNWVCPECDARKEDFEMVEI